MEQPAPIHTDPTHDAYQPHSHLSLLHPVQAVMDLEQAVEYKVVETAFGVVARLPPSKPKPESSPAIALLKRWGGNILKLAMGMNQCNGTTNGWLKGSASQDPGEFIDGLGVYAATLVVASIGEFAMDHMHGHHLPALHLPAADPKRCSIGVP